MAKIGIYSATVGRIWSPAFPVGVSGASLQGGSGSTVTVTKPKIQPVINGLPPVNVNPETSPASATTATAAPVVYQANPNPLPAYDPLSSYSGLSSSPLWSPSVTASYGSTGLSGRAGALVIGLLLFAAMAFGQVDNTIHVKTFPGENVGAKVANAMAACPVGPCILVIDPSLASTAPGVLPTLCASCYLQDYRQGPPPTLPGVSSDGYNGIKVQGAVAGGATTVTNSGSGAFNASAYSGFSQNLINSCDPATEWRLLQGGGYPTDGVASCMIAPVAATSGNMNGIAAYLENPSSTLGGGVGGAVGLYTQVRCTANSSYCWGANPLVSDAAGVTGSFLVGTEIDVNVAGTPSFLVGLQINGQTSGTVPASSNAIEIDRLFGAGLNVSDGTISSNNGVFLGSESKTGTSNSMNIGFSARNSGGTRIIDYLGDDSSGNLNAAIYSGGAVQAYNESVATSGANQFVPALNLIGSMWNGSAAVSNDWSISELAPSSGTPSYDILNISNSGSPTTTLGVQIPNQLYITTTGGGSSIIHSTTSTANVGFSLPNISTSTTLATLGAQTFSATQTLPNAILTAAASTTGSGEIGLGSATVISTSCGSLSGASGCWVINVAGTTRYVPFF